MELCIYLDQKGIDILGYKRLKIFDVAHFNDPYEFMIAKHNDRQKDEIRREIIKKINEARVRVICFSKNHNNILMWGHYTNKHKGLMIKFETDKLRIDNQNLNPNALHKVEYKHSPWAITEDLADKWNNYKKINPLAYKSLYDFSKNSEASEIINNTITNAIKTKSIDWQYEEEYRILIDGHSFSQGWVNINAESIIEVIIGQNMDPYNTSIIKSILTRDEYKHVVPLKRAYKSTSKYEMDYIEEI